jgi:hypothetical protein
LVGALQILFEQLAIVLLDHRSHLFVGDIIGAY